jgi:hypothetical protein
METSQDSPWNTINPVPKLDLTAISVILWNLFPVIGVILWGWDPANVFIFYALETIVVGGFNVLKLMVVYKYGLPPKPDETGVNGLGIIPFFIAHYFFFVFVQLTIFFSASDTYLNPIKLTQYIADHLGVISFNSALGAFVTNCVIEFVSNFLGTGKYKNRTMAEQMYEPYPRIFVQQFVVILGSFFYMMTGTGYAVMIIFVGIKIYVDLILKDFDLISVKQALEKGKSV